MKRKYTGSLFLVLLVFASITVLSHHGTGGYDRNSPVTLTGMITRVELVNPHSFVYIDVKDGKGRIENWALEGNPPAILTRQGWTKDELKVGTVLTVIGFPPRQAGPSGYGTSKGLEDALSYSSAAIDHLKSSHILQVGDIRISGGIRQFGMGPSFVANR